MNVSERVTELYDQGKFDEAIALAQVTDANLGKFSVEEKWQILIAKSQLASGQYSAALKTLDDALARDRLENSIRLRWIGIEICRFNNNPDRAMTLFNEIAQLASSKSYLYRNTPSRIVLAKHFLSQQADAKSVLDTFYNPLKKRSSRDPQVYRAIGEMAFAKHDYGLAAENFQKVIEFGSGGPDDLCDLAKCFLPSDSAKANSLINQALAINSNHTESLLIVADQHISSERYDEAEKTLAQILTVNAKHPIAWAYRAVIAHLNNDPAKEGECRTKAMDAWNGNPEVDYVIGRELSEKYRFKESEKYQRRALVYNKNFLPAKMQLAHDLLRLGQEMEGWKLADEVFTADQYSVVAHNLVTLRDHISKFKTLQRDGFVVRMETGEAEIYGNRVLDVLSDAKKTLCEKYDTELETPIFIEIFPRQQDFAIRTFGLPGGSGFLGVCFGRVITMNSPAAQGANLTSWESVLWHEFCHVVTLQKTKNKMPRWLSEGISVYEENLKDSAWGEPLNPRYRTMLLGEELTPVSKLSGAFLRPPSGLHLQFAYYESSLVVEFLIKEYGIKSILSLLDELSNGTPINDALRRHAAPVEFIDKKFTGFAKSRAASYAPNADWDSLKNLDEEKRKQLTSIEDWVAWNKEHPTSVEGLLSESAARIAAKDWKGAIDPLEKAIALSPTLTETYPMLARAYRETGQSENEFATLEKLVTLEANEVNVFTRLLEITTRKNDWDKTKTYSRKLLALNPLLSAPHRYLSIAAEKTQDDAAIVQSLSVLAKMDPLDAADVHYRLASALHRKGDLGLAKRQAILALEVAPRYRDAHALLMQIVDDENQNKKQNDSNKEDKTTQ
ncbi:MAG: tetratricopeptide repeat protein [Mariniblastus sp.]